MEITDKYLGKVASFLKGMLPGQEVDLSKSPTKDAFLFVVNIWIQQYGGFELNETKLKRLNDTKNDTND